MTSIEVAPNRRKYPCQSETFAIKKIYKWLVEDDKDFSLVLVDVNDSCEPKFKCSIDFSSHKNLKFSGVLVDFNQNFPVKLEVDISFLNSKNEKIKTIDTESFTFYENTNDLRINVAIGSMEPYLDKKRPHNSNGLLTILSEVVIETGVKKISKTEEQFDMPKNLLQDSLNMLLLDDRFTDVVFHVDGITFKAHKIILSCQSQVFATMFDNEDKNEFFIEDTNPRIFKKLLEFIYTNKQPLEIEKVSHEFLTAAHKFQIRGVINECLKSLFHNISTENALETLILADKLGEKQLKTAIISFIKHHSSFLQSAAYKTFERDNTKLSVEISSAVFENLVHRESSTTVRVVKIKKI